MILLPKELLSVAATIQSDTLFTKDLKEKTDQAVEDTIIATRIVDGFKNPHQHGIYLKNHASFPLECAFFFCFRRASDDGSPWWRSCRFFTRVTQQMQERLQWYRNTIEVSSFSVRFFLVSLNTYPKQIERKLSSTAVQAQATPQGNLDRPVYLRSLTPSASSLCILQWYPPPCKPNTLFLYPSRPRRPP